jgi:hypothetical protein
MPRRVDTGGSEQRDFCLRRRFRLRDRDAQGQLGQRAGPALVERFEELGVGEVVVASDIEEERALAFEPEKEELVAGVDGVARATKWRWWIPQWLKRSSLKPRRSVRADW